MKQTCLSILAFVVLWFASSPDIDAAQSPPSSRGIPKSLPAHPGNVFIEGEDVVVPLPKSDARWSLVNYDGQALGEFTAQDGTGALGKRSVGFYRLRQAGSSNWISLGVLAPLRTPTPQTSPIAMDVAMAWFYPKEKMDAAASLCALAGVNCVRDRLSWPEMEPKRDEFSAPNKYDASASAQSQAGLQVLQVIHASPSWANKNGKRFPTDLRDAYRFYETMAKRWRGQVIAFEPWNEADIPMFGGHTGAEMAALQKAAYLGLKAGNPDIVACLNVFAMHNTNQLADLHENEAWPYFDTYNLHHYESFDRFPKLYADHRAVSAGRPLWVSECSVPVKWAGDEKLKEPTDADLRVQAERVAKTFACSLYEGSAATYYFLLPHYVEGQTQFGIVRPDLTPRPAFVALAAVGRLLADAKPLGRLKPDDATVRAFLFRARPDGKEVEVLVAWATNGAASLGLSVPPTTGFDHLGRVREMKNELQLSIAPQFALFPKGSAQKLILTPPPPAPARLTGEPSPMVLQALWAEDKTDLKLSAYRMSAGPQKISVFAYNFSKRNARGKLQLTAPPGWKLDAPENVELAPMERREFHLTSDAPPSVTTPLELKVSGDFGSAGKPVLSIQVLGAP